jgi:acyl carrier protein
MSNSDAALFDGVVGAIRAAKQASGDLVDYQITLDSRLHEGDLKMDSIDYVAMLVAIEEEFGVIASDEDFSLDSVDTVADVVDVVRRLTHAQRR